MQALEKITYNNNWITILLLILFASIVLLKILNARKLKESFFALLNFTLIEDKDAEGASFFDPFQIVIFLFSIATISFFLFNVKLHFFPDNSSDFSSFFTFFVGLLFYFLLKRIFEHALSILFLIKNRLKFFQISKSNYLYSISFLLYIAIILFEYAKINKVFIFYFAAFLFLIRFVFILVRNKKLIFNKLFYFILYICAFEIAPLFVLFKLMF